MNAVDTLNTLIALTNAGGPRDAQDRKAKTLVANLSPAERAACLEELEREMFPKPPLPRCPGPRKIELASIRGYFELHESVLAEYKTIKPKALPYTLLEGFSAAPTAFVRSGLFNDVPQSETRVFKVLGLTNMTIERSGGALGQNNLQALMLAISKVRDYDEKLGTTVEFNAWEAVETLGWTRSTQSLVRLKQAIDQLRATTVRVMLDEKTQTEEAAPLIARALTSLDDRTKWEIQLTSTLLNALAQYRTFLNFETLAALPNGAATWLYAFIESEPRERTEWDLDDIAEAAGLTSGNRYEIKRKLKAALRTLKAGKVEVKARGKAVYNEERGELVDKGGKLVVRSTSSQIKTFTPPLSAYEFRKTQAGKERVVIYRKTTTEETA